MPCYSPLKAYRLGSLGKLFFHRPADYDTELDLPCGRCVGCRLERSRQWATRCMNESSLYSDNCFITLTYRDAPLSLDYRDFQLFMKRLRKQFGSVRFYMCGEYGEKNFRPHYHAILFGFNFGDRVRFTRTLFRSPTLERLWPHGHSSIGAVTFESCAYVSRYIMKKITGQMADDYYSRTDPVTGEIVQVTPEFCHMSLKPGIGARWLDRYVTDVYPDGQMVSRGNLSTPPRYYDKRFKRIDRDAYDWMKDWRWRAKRANDPSLESKAAVAEARVGLLKRKL